VIAKSSTITRKFGVCQQCHSVLLTHKHGRSHDFLTLFLSNADNLFSHRPKDTSFPPKSTRTLPAQEKISLKTDFSLSPGFLISELQQICKTATERSLNMLTSRKMSNVRHYQQKISRRPLQSADNRTCLVKR